MVVFTINKQTNKKQRSHYTYTTRRALRIRLDRIRVGITGAEASAEAEVVGSTLSNWTSDVRDLVPVTGNPYKLLLAGK